MRALLIANMRSASNFTTQALDSHPDLVWDTGEPLNPQSEWYADWMTDSQILNDVHDACNGCKVSYVQAWDNVPVYWYIERQKLRVMHLTRTNVIRWTLSVFVERVLRHRPAFADKENLPMAQIAVEPGRFMDEAYRVHAQQRTMSKQLNLLTPNLLELDYSDIVGYEGNTVECIHEPTARSICRFLDIPYAPMCGQRRGVNRYPIADIVTNWDKLRKEIVNSTLAYHLTDEENFNDS